MSRLVKVIVMVSDFNHVRPVGSCSLQGVIEEGPFDVEAQQVSTFAVDAYARAVRGVAMAPEAARTVGHEGAPGQDEPRGVLGRQKRKGDR